MNWQFGIFMFCIAVFYVVLVGGIGIYINAEKGRSKFFGFFIALFVPVIGIIALAFNKPSSEYLIAEAENRNLISKSQAKDLKVLAVAQDTKIFATESKFNEVTQEFSLIIKNRSKNKKNKK